MTTTTEKSSQDNKFSLLNNLPAELRLIIYEEVLASSPIVYWESNPQTWRRYFLARPALLEAHQQIAIEALPIYERLLREAQTAYEEHAADNAASYRAYHSWHEPGFCPSFRGQCIWLDVQAQRARDGADEVKRLVERESEFWSERMSSLGLAGGKETFSR